MTAVARWLRRAVRVPPFLLWYFYSLLRANLIVAAEVFRPELTIEPAIVRVPITAASDFEVAVLANLISLAPGTLTVDTNPQGDVLYVHGLHVETGDALREHINDLEARLLRALR